MNTKAIRNLSAFTLTMASINIYCLTPKSKKRESTKTQAENKRKELIDHCISTMTQNEKKLYDIYMKNKNEDHIGTKKDNIDETDSKVSSPYDLKSEIAIKKVFNRTRSKHRNGLNFLPTKSDIENTH